jgi:DNA recombination protein RmuC
VEVVIIVLLVYLVGVTAYLLYRSTRPSDLTAPLQNLTQAVQQEQTQSAVLSEKLERLGPIAQTVGNIREGLTQLRTYVEARQQLEQQTSDSIRRLEAVIAGTQTKGTAGENILEAVFAQLPPDWQVRDYRVGNKVVEFGLRLPNGLVLPIDSKWAATSLLERFMESEDINEKQRLKRDIETAVVSRAREVRKYLDPNLTVSFGVAVVPDAIYDLCAGVQAQVFQLNVVVVSHSMFVPYLMLVFQTVLKTSRTIDLQKLDTYLASCQRHVGELQKELEGRFSRALAMLNNSRNEMAAGLSQVSGELTSLKIGAALPAGEETPALAEPSPADES